MHTTSKTRASEEQGSGNLRVPRYRGLGTLTQRVCADHFLRRSFSTPISPPGRRILWSTQIRDFHKALSFVHKFGNTASLCMCQGIKYEPNAYLPRGVTSQDRLLRGCGCLQTPLMISVPYRHLLVKSVMRWLNDSSYMWPTEYLPKWLLHGLEQDTRLVVGII